MSTELIDTDNKPVATDMRHVMMTLPVDRQNELLTEYKARRDNFRQWLMRQLVEGVHYGVVPGCEPKTKEINGVVHFGVWNKRANGGKGAMEWYPPTQWQMKPSLYAAGADFVCDLLGVRDEYDTDLAGWQQMGSKPGNAVVKCKLISRATGEIVGESLGAAYHQYDPNNALKMASKCSKVGAVINAYDLRDLFTQDEPSGPPHDNPQCKPNAPTAPPRSMRIAPEVVKVIPAEWQVQFGSGDKARDKALYVEWVTRTTGRDFNPLTYSLWTAPDVDKCAAALGMPVDNQEGIPF